MARIFYMALPPNVFTPVAQGLKRNVYPEKGIARLIVPPPHNADECPLIPTGRKTLWQRPRILPGPPKIPRPNLE